MWFRKRILFLVTLTIATSMTAHADETLKLSIEDARKYAVEHNRDLVNAGLAVSEAGERLRETIAQGLPQVDAMVDYNNFFGSTATLGAMPGFEIEFNPTSNLQLSVGQMIFSGSYIVGVRSARLFKEVTETTRERTGLEIRAQVTQAYYLALISGQSFRLVEANLDNVKAIKEQTRAMVQAGVAEEVDYDQLSVQVNMLENALRAADRQVELSYNMLRLQMGLFADVPVTLTDDIDEIIGRSDFEGSLLATFNISENLEYQLVDLQTNIAEQQVDMARAEYLPTITGFYNFTEKLLKPEFDITPNHVIGFNVSVPIFSSGVRQSRIRQARINLDIAKNQKALLSEQLSIQEKQLRYNLNNAIEQYDSQKANVEVSRRVYQNITNKYRQGMASSLDLTTANNNYLQAENSYVSALMQLLEAHVAMEKLLNEI